MIGYVRGKVSHVFDDYCFIDVQGVGYRLYITTQTREKLIIGADVSLFTHLNVREDALLLYGFYTQDEYEMFLHLVSVTGIGPRVAVGVLSAIRPIDFRLAVSQKNYTVLTKIPGIGKKTAERMVLELRDKIGVPSSGEGESDFSGIVESGLNGSQDEAIAALIALGYSQAEIVPVIRKLSINASTTEQLIKLALKEFARR